MDINIADNELPEWVHEMVAAAIEKHPEIGAATQQATRRIRRHAEFGELVDLLVARAIRRLVNDARHNRSRQIKREAGEYGKGPKIDYQRSDRVKTFHTSMYDLAVAGTLLGELRGEQLDDAINRERLIGSGHLAVAELVESIKPMVPAGKRVRDVVPEKKIRALWTQIRTSASAGAA